MSGRVLGVVLSAGEAGFGFVGAEGRQYFVHISAIDAPAAFVPGTPVEFTPMRTARGLAARDVAVRPDADRPPAGPRVLALVRVLGPHGDYAIGTAGRLRLLIHARACADGAWPLAPGDTVEGEVVKTPRGTALVFARRVGGASRPEPGSGHPTAAEPASGRAYL